MLSAISAWLATQGASLVLGALAKIALDAWATYQATRAQQDLARAEVERDQAVADRAATEAQLQAQIDAPKSIDDAVKRLEEESA